MPTLQPAYPTPRAFVVQIHAETNVTQGEMRGRSVAVGNPKSAPTPRLTLGIAGAV
jgi:hypothetical protein